MSRSRKIPISQPARRGRGLARLAFVLGLGLGLAGCGGDPAVEQAARAKRLAAQTGGLTDEGLQRLASRLDPATLALARRHDPARGKDLWGRPPGWTSYRLAELPSLGFGTTFDDTARRINALKPYARLPIAPMSPFVLKAGARDRTAALNCLSQAIYYEAGYEAAEGQEAVAQIVLNRVRHPAYPNSVCGVVYQGSARRTGCQFSFTCDGSLERAPDPAGWARAQAVARQALGGFVLKDVGPATHYHADYVAPYWSPTLVKLTRIGAHIFYRWTGPGGEPPAFVGRYRGGEADIPPAVLGGIDARTQGAETAPSEPGRTVTLNVAGEVRTYAVADPTAEDGTRTRVSGVLTPSRRRPTAEEVKRINESLAAMEAARNKPAEAPVSP